MSPEIEFFPRLTRRPRYSAKRSGEYYSYSRYREEIRKDCLGRCVYCDIHENENGGAESMNLDHFRPQEKYKHLKNDPHNLVWSCRGCNRLKHSHWPASGTPDTFVGQEGFIDPFMDDRRSYLRILPDGELVPVRPPAQYMIGRLALNRSTRKRVRELRLVKLEWLRRFDEQIACLHSLLADAIAEKKNRQEAGIKACIAGFQELRDEAEQHLFDFELHTEDV